RGGVDLDAEGAVKGAPCTPTRGGPREVSGATLPAAVLYAQRAFIEEKPRTTQALVNALVRGLKWIASRPAAEVAAVMPSDYALGGKALYAQSIEKSLPMYSRDGRFANDAAETAYGVLKAFDPDVGRAKIDISVTYTNAFVGKVPAQP